MIYDFYLLKNEIKEKDEELELDEWFVFEEIFRKDTVLHEIGIYSFNTFIISSSSTNIFFKINNIFEFYDLELIEVLIERLMELHKQYPLLLSEREVIAYIREVVKLYKENKSVSIKNATIVIESGDYSFYIKAENFSKHNIK